MTNLTFTPTSNFNTPVNGNNLITSTVPAQTLNNLPIDVIIVPEPGSLLLGFLALAAGLLVRLRKKRG